VLDLDYIECAGVRVPADWTFQKLRDALAGRKIRFANEQEIANVFGKAVLLKFKLQSEIDGLVKQRQELRTEVILLKTKLLCPNCQKPIMGRN